MTPMPTAATRLLLRTWLRAMRMVVRSPLRLPEPTQEDMQPATHVRWEMRQVTRHGQPGWIWEVWSRDLRARGFCFLPVAAELEMSAMVKRMRDWAVQ